MVSNRISSDVILKIKQLEIFTRRLLNGTLVGDSRSAIKGTGFEFDQIREYNCGDDAFMEVFKYLYLGTPHKYKFSDRYLFGQKTDICVLGGGDVINDYFVKSIPDNVNSIAVGVGIPYDEFIPMLKRFCAVYLRNKKIKI